MSETATRQGLPAPLSAPAMTQAQAIEKLIGG